MARPHHAGPTRLRLVQEGAPGGGGSYLINLGSGGKRGGKGAHLRKPQSEVRKVTRRRYAGWTFDLATQSGRFAAGVGMVVVHNSPRRGETFLTRKITRAVAAIVAERQELLFLGNLNAKRDWDHARDYVLGIWLMLQQPEPRDYVVGTGETYTVGEFAERAFSRVGLDWESFVRIDPAYYRPTEVEHLHSDPSETIAALGWKPQTRFAELVDEMVDADLGDQGFSLDQARARVAERFDEEQRRG